MLEEAVKKIVEGIRVQDCLIYAKEVSKGRFRDEVNLDIFLKKEDKETHLLYIKVFYGRSPLYLLWVEFFGINENVKIGEEVIQYFDSSFEDRILQFFSEHLGPGDKIFIEYYNDRETANALIHDVPPPLTRLGYKLFNLGFSWFKDWYFPEGYNEGGQKLQGEKPFDDEARRRHLRYIYDTADDFIKKAANYPKDGSYISNALSRAKEILNKISPSTL
jgi:hypothetical protein